jgi:hypothetical protein
MQTDSPSTNDSLPGLPTVSPPSGKFIAQLFFVPFLIVAVLVGFTLFIQWFGDKVWSPEEYLEKLDSSNPDVRWRGAETLAQVLLREEQLASNPKFALDIAERLRRAWQAELAEERNSAQARQPGPGETLLPKTLEPGREHLLYLSACLGNVMLPVGAPLLNEMAVNVSGSDARAIARRRWRTVWALANLGENLKRFDKLPGSRREAVLAELQQEAASGRRERAGWASQALTYLKSQEGRSLQVLGVDEALTRCAEDPDPFLREMAAFALNFWEGTAGENARLEGVLAKLAADNGHGEDQLSQLRDEPQQGEEALTRAPGLKIRYNATISLARRGSDKSRLGVLQEMLDVEQQRENFRVKRRDGQVVPDEPTVGLTVSTALQAVAELHRHRPARDLSQLESAVASLTRSDNSALRNEAAKTQTALARN